MPFISQIDGIVYHIQSEIKQNLCTTALTGRRAEILFNNKWLS